MRIQMMNTERPPSSHLFRYAWVLPAVFFMHFIVSPQSRSLQAMDLHANSNSVVIPRAFNGFYAMEGNAHYVLRIETTTQGLLLKELWTGKETAFQRVSEAEYWNPDRAFPVKFTSGGDGTPPSLVAFERDRWVKIEDLDSWIKQEFRLTPEELKAFEGYYQFEKNSDAYLKFTVKENGLVAREMWSGNEFFIVPKSALEFYSKTSNYPVAFARNQSGSVTQAVVFKEDVWKKVAEYAPRKTVTLSPEKLKAFEGRYTHQFEPGKDSFIEITAAEDHLTLKELWSGNETRFVPSSELEFFNRQRRFALKFTKDKTGKVISVLAFNKDVWTRE